MVVLWLIWAAFIAAYLVALVLTALFYPFRLVGRLFKKG